MSEYHNTYDRVFSVAFEKLGSAGLEAAKEYVFSLPDPDHRNATLAKLAVALAEQGQSAGLQLIDDVDRPLDRADAFIAVGRVYANKQQRTEAKEAFARAVSSSEAITSRGWEIPAIMVQASEGLRSLDFTLEALSLLKRAVPLAQEGTDIESARILGGCAILLAKWGYKEEASSVVERISYPSLKAMTHERICQLP